MTNVKRYPWNAERNAHNVVFRKNRAWNELAEEEGNGTLTAAKRARYEEVIDKCNEVLGMCINRDHRGIVWLTGAQIGWAKECTCWAVAQRG